MERHVYVANRIADHIRVIAALMNELSAEQLRLLPPMTDAMAKALEASAPFTPLTEEERQLVYASVYDEMGDMSARDMADVMVEHWCEADWRDEFDNIVEE